MHRTKGKRAEESTVQRSASEPSSGRSLTPPRSGIGFLDKAGARIHRVASSGFRGRPSRLPHMATIQRSFGRHDVSRVQAFSDKHARNASRALGARAYARGTKVAFSGRPSLRTAAHEAAHVVQQRGGVQLKSGVGAPGDKYERHADEVADLVVQGKSAERLLSKYARGSATPPSDGGAVQGEWISRHKNQNTLYRFWKRVDSDTDDRDTGWFKRQDEAGDWSTNNVEEALNNEVTDFATETDLLPDQITSHQTRYDPTTLTADPVSHYTQQRINQAQAQTSNLTNTLTNKVREHGTVLQQPLKTYRWGEYRYEKNYVINNGFSLGNVNFGSAIYGQGLYVATTPWGSAGYATDNDGSLIEVTIPRGTLMLNFSKTVATKQYSFKHKKFLRRAVFSQNEQNTLTNNPKYPPVLMVDDSSGWAVIKDDSLNLDINFYQPNENELATVAPHLNARGDTNGYLALQIINRQLGNPIHMPSKQNMLAMYINQPEGKRQRVQKYIQDIKRYQFVPFMLSNNGLNFNDEVNGILGSFTHSARYNKHFQYVEPTVKMWAANPFALPSDDYRQLVVKPFDDAFTAYKQDRKDEKDNANIFQAWGLKYFSTGGKISKLGQLSKRLSSFKSFLETIDSKHRDLADDQKSSHVGIKVGHHRGMMARGANTDARKEAISETMLRGTPQVANNKTPTAIVMMGLPGSGKSSVIRLVAPDIENYVVADPDAAKEGLPEFQAGIRRRDRGIAGRVHDESKNITDYAVQQARGSRRNIIYDTTGVGFSPVDLAGLRGQGYHVKLVYVHVPLNTAKQRVLDREQQTGRGVPENIITNIHGMMGGSLISLAPRANKVLLYNNSGTSPQLIWQGNGSAATQQLLRRQIARMQ